MEPSLRIRNRASCAQTCSETRRKLERYADVIGRPCNLLMRDPLQETLRRGIIMPSLVVSYSHSNEDIDRTIHAVDAALGVYALALGDGVEAHWVGRPSRTVFRPARTPSSGLPARRLETPRGQGRRGYGEA